MTARGKVKISGRLSGSLYHPNWRNNRKLTLITYFALVSWTVIVATIHGPLGGRHDGEPTRRDVVLLCFSSVPNGRQTNVNFVPQFRHDMRATYRIPWWGTLSILFSQNWWKINDMSRSHLLRSAYFPEFPVFSVYPPISPARRKLNRINRTSTPKCKRKNYKDI